MRPIARLALALAAALVVAGSAAAEPDPRVAEADALLGDASAYGRAADLYRAALAEGDDSAVRQRLARVLAWSQSYDESIAEYDRLLAQAPPPPGARIERAEVLSWAGRLPEAMAAYEAILADEPENARAARGLARAERWAGQVGRADRAYERALGLEEDAEARDEWAKLRAGSVPRSAAEFDWLRDSDEFQRMGSRLVGSFFPDLDTLVTARAGVIDLHGPRIASAPGLPRRDRGADLSLGLRRALRPGLQAELELGARVYREAGATPLARGRLEWAVVPGSVLSLEVDHRDALDRSDSLAALEDGIRDTTTRLSIWKALPRRFELFADGQLGALSDSNLRRAAGATLSWQPWSEHELRLQLGVGYLATRRRSDLYYDPEWDVSGVFGVTHRQELPGHFLLDLEAKGGYGGSRESGAASQGPAYELASALGWRVGPVRLAVRASRGSSQRESSYAVNRFFATVGLDLPR